MKKKQLVFYVLIFISVHLSAQKKEVETATKYRPGIMWFFTGLEPSSKIWAPRFDRLMIDIKYNDLIHPSSIKLFNTKGSSIGFNTQFVFDIPMNFRNTAAFGIGIGYEFSKFVHNKAILPFNGNQFDFSDSVSSDKSILRTHTFFVPVELRFRTKGWQHFKFHIGSNIGYRFGNNKTYQDDAVNRIRTGKMNNFEWLYLDVHARVGIRNWALLISANMLPVFRKTGIKTIPVSLGITISLY